MRLRDFQPGDAEAFTEVLRHIMPFQPAQPEALIWRATRAPASHRNRLFVAEVGGQIVGVARTGLTPESPVPGMAVANVLVLPEARGQGIGTRLLEACEDHLRGAGARIVAGWVSDDEASQRFAVRHGYRRRGASTFQRLDLATANLPELPVPDGVAVRTGVDYEADPTPLYRADVEAGQDEPSMGRAADQSYEEWRQLIWERPDIDHTLTSVAVVDGVVAAYSLPQTDGRDRYWSGMTGTVRAYRGRGLAKLVKVDSLRRAQQAGYREAYTVNDTTNQPMLAINRWLGYQPGYRQWRYERELTAVTPTDPD